MGRFHQVMACVQETPNEMQIKHVKRACDFQMKQQKKYQTIVQ